MRDAINSALRWINTLSPQDWLITLTVVVALGFLLLRGFGSRQSY